MSGNDVNLAALWVPVMASTSELKGQLVRAGTEGGAASAVAFREAFASSGAFSDIGKQFNRQFMGLGLPSGLLQGFEGLFSRTKAAEAATQSLIRTHEVLTDTLRREEIAQARLNEVQESGAGGRSLLAATLAADVAHRKSAEAKEADAKAEATYQNALQRSSGALAAFSSIANGAGLAATVGLGAAMVGTADKAAKFQQQMIRLHASAGETGDMLGGQFTGNLRVVSDGILQLASQVGYSTTQLADGMYTVEKSGYRGAEGIKVLTAAAQLAKAENADLGEVLSGLTTSMNDFNIPTDQAADVASKLNVAVGMAKTNLQDFSGALHSVEPVAMMAHIGLDQVYGSLARLTQSGMSADQASQNLAQTIRNFAGPTQPMRDALGKIGLSASDLQKELGDPNVGLTGVLGKVAERVRQLGGPDGQVAINAFYKNADAVGALKTAFDALNPASQEWAKKMQDGTLSGPDLKDLRIAEKNDPALKQFDAMRNKVDGLSQNLKKLNPDLETTLQIFKEVSGGAETLNVLSQLFGSPDDAKKTTDAVHAVGQAHADAKGQVAGFADTMEGAQAKLDQARAAFGAAEAEIGSAFIPVLVEVANVAKDVGDAMAKHPAIVHAAVEAVGALSGAWLTFKGISVADAMLNPISKALTGMTIAETAAADSAGVLGKALGALGPIAAGAAAAIATAPAVMHGLDDNHWLNDNFRNPVREFFGAAPMQTGSMDHSSIWDTSVAHNAAGGGISGPGSKGKDSVLSWLAPGEHVLTAADVDALGGQSGVYALRQALHRAGGGSVSESGGVGDGAFRKLLRGGDHRSGHVLHRQGGGEIPHFDGGGGTPGGAGGTGGTGGLNLNTIPVAAQKYANDCIDASARIILSHSGVNMTEDQMEGVIAPGGTIASQAAGMNRLDPGGGFKAMPGAGGSPAAMFAAIKASIDNGTGSVLNVAPGSSIAGRNFSEGHFIAATGYNPDGTINLSDTARGTKYSVSPADAFQATQGRGIVAGTGTARSGGNIPLGTSSSPIYTTPSREHADRADARVKEIQERLSELKPDAKQSTKDRLNDELGFAQQDQARAHDQEAMSGGSSTGGSGSGGGQGKTQSQAQQFGSGLLSGLMSDMGFGNVLGGESPLQWPLVKLFTGLASTGLNAGNAWAESKMSGSRGGGGSPGGSPFGGGVPGLNTGGAGFGGESVSGLGNVSAGLGGGQSSADAALSGMNPGGAGGGQQPSDIGKSPMLKFSNLKNMFGGGFWRDGDQGPNAAGGGSGGGPGIHSQDDYRLFQAGVLDANGNQIPHGPVSGPIGDLMKGGTKFPTAPQSAGGSYIPSLMMPGADFGPGLLGGPGDSPGTPYKPFTAPSQPSKVGPSSGPPMTLVPHFATGGVVNPPNNDKWTGGGFRTGDPNGVWHREWDENVMSPWGKTVPTSSHGTDTVPAMLTPGEFVVNPSAAKQFGPQLKSMNAQHFASGGNVSLTPSSVSSVPTAASSQSGGTSYSGGHSTHYDNRIIVQGNHLSDADQLAAPMQERQNAAVYARSAFGGLPYAVGPGGG